MTVVREREIASEDEKDVVIEKQQLNDAPKVIDDKELETGYDYYDGDEE